MVCNCNYIFQRCANMYFCIFGISINLTILANCYCGLSFHSFYVCCVSGDLLWTFNVEQFLGG